MATFLSGAAASVVGDGGRRAVARRCLEKGEVALRTPALAATLLGEFRARRCDHCFGEIGKSSTGSEAVRTLRCSRCQSMYYCNRTCQESHWKWIHKAECSCLTSLREGLSEAGFQGDAAFKDALLAARCLRGGRDLSSASGSLSELESLAGRMHQDEHDQLKNLASVVARVPKLLPEGADSEAVLIALCCFKNNNFAVVNDLFIAVGAGCFPKGATLNHSCAPNCLLTYEIGNGRLPVQIIRTMEHVAEGVELTHSYVDIALPSWDRQSQLRDTYGFDCNCSLCTSNVRSQLDATLVADIAQEGAVAASENCPLLAASPCADRDRALSLANRLFHEALAEDNINEELRRLEEVCNIRERYLHANHLEVQAAHASAHTASVAALDWERAEKHCGNLVEQYLRVYPQWHPILGLQMYTLAELKEQCGSVKEAKSWYLRARDVLIVSHGSQHTMVEDLDERIQALKDV